MNRDANAAKPKSFLMSAFLGSVQLALVVAVLAAALILNRLLVAGGEEAPPRVSATRAPLVEIIKPDVGAEQVVITETGVIEARTEVAIAPEVSGRVLSAAPGFAAGGAFQAGEVLFRIDPEDYRLQVQQAQAELNTAASALALEDAEATSAIREWRLINGDEPIPPLVAREPQLAQARASVETAEARLAAARLDLSRTAFSMPFDGRVLSTTIEPGLTVNLNQSYGTVFADDALEAVISLPLEDLERIAPAVGRAARVTIISGFGDRVVDAEIIRVESVLDARSRLASVVLAFDRETGTPPGAFIEVDILGPVLDDMVRLPAEAVSPTGLVWVLDGAVLRRRPVSVVSRTDDVVLARAFDMVGGVVLVPPAGARDGLEVRLTDDAPGDSLAAIASGEQ